MGDFGFSFPEVNWADPYDEERDGFQMRPDFGGYGPTVAPPSGNFDPMMFGDTNYETPVQDRYMQHLQDVPVPTDPRYKMGKLNWLGALLAAAGTGRADKGYEIVNQIQDRPYQQDYETWKAKALGLQGASTNEARTIYNRQAGRRNLLAAFKEIRDQQTQNLTDQKLKLETEKLQGDLQQQGFQKFTDKDGVEWMVHPFDGRRIKLGQTAAVTPGERALDRNQEWKIASMLEGGRNTRFNTGETNENNRADVSNQIRVWAARQNMTPDSIFTEVSIKNPYFRAALEKIAADPNTPFENYEPWVRQALIKGWTEYQERKNMYNVPPPNFGGRR